MQAQWQTIKDQCPNLYREGVYFECLPGWHKIILDLSLKLEEIIKRHPHGEAMYASQVKEKYGSLRFYMSCETEAITKLIEEAEHLSCKICEACGEPGKHRIKSWSETRCDKCFNSLEANLS